MKAEVDKPGINKLTNVPTSLNTLKTKVDSLDVGKLKTVPVALEKAIDFNTLNFNTLKAKVNNLDTKIPDVTILIQINQYNADKKN